MSHILHDFWMVEIPLWDEYVGFDKTIIFEVEPDVWVHIRNVRKFASVPVFTILRGWIIWKNRLNLWRQKEWEWIRYTPLYIDSGSQRIRAVYYETWKKVWEVIWNMHQYVISNGKVFTAKKYSDEWKQK
jgi:hypothetical protein